MPDPNLVAESLFQQQDNLPTTLQKSHFEEGLVCTMTLNENKKKLMLAMIIELREQDFLYRVFFYQNSKAKTWHEGARDKDAKYDAVWRLAPRQELYREEESENVRVGQTIRFSYAMDEKMITGFVVERTSSSLKCRIECGRDRGSIRVFAQNEIVGCKEVFTASSLQNLLVQAKNSTWKESPASKSKELPKYRPRLKFLVPTEEACKRR